MDKMEIAKYILLLGLLILNYLSSGVRGLQCYNCRGVTNYDPNQCFIPVLGKTILQECKRGEICEKKIHRVDYFHEVVERGCSSNCDGRKYIWTVDFRVHCCDNDELCNVAPRARLTSPWLLLLGVVTAFYRWAV